MREPQKAAAFGSPVEITVGVLADSGNCEGAGAGAFALLAGTDDVVGVVDPLRHRIALLRSRQLLVGGWCVLGGASGCVFVCLRVLRSHFLTHAEGQAASIWRWLWMVFSFQELSTGRAVGAAGGKDPQCAASGSEQPLNATSRHPCHLVAALEVA
ncbi:hypothetical protein HMPREF2651_06660 [Corynebacterium sp. HMSC063A05]|nr:hypothetical protein HMPREF2651_06660 [Corynebacterium sp. HMSC063A05]